VCPPDAAEKSRLWKNKSLWPWGLCPTPWPSEDHEWKVFSSVWTWHFGCPVQHLPFFRDLFQ
jgi:hypothetical protein